MTSILYVKGKDTEIKSFVLGVKVNITQCDISKVIKCANRGMEMFKMDDTNVNAS